jgi:polygalacturonase
MHRWHMSALFIQLSLSFLLFVGCEQSSSDNFDDNVNAIVASIVEPQVPDRLFDLVEFSGHSPDAAGRYDFRNDIQRAIDSLDVLGGGTLLFSHSTEPRNWLRYEEVYRVRGSIQLKSNIRLLFEPSVRLFFEFDPPSYLLDGKPVLTRYEGTTLYTFSPCIRAFNAENIIIESVDGSGQMPIITGDGEEWQRWMWEGEKARQARGLKPSYQVLKEINSKGLPVRELVFDDPDNDFFRPALLQFFLCKNIRVEGIKITESPFWCLHPVFCEHVILRNLAFDAYVVNNDGIDPESSRNVLIENIQFGNHDDNIAIKAGRDREGREGADISGTEVQTIDSPYINNSRIGGPMENVVIRHCVFKGHYAIAIGSEMSGGVRHIYADHNVSVQDVNMGFFIKSSRTRGGVVEDVFIRDLHLNRVDKDVISMIPNYDDDAISPFPPIFRRIRLENISAVSSENGIRLFGWPDAPVQDIQFHNVKIQHVDNINLQIEQAQNINMKDVFINNQKFDGAFDSVDSTKTTPHQI